MTIMNDDLKIIRQALKWLNNNIGQRDQWTKGNKKETEYAENLIKAVSFVKQYIQRRPDEKTLLITWIGDQGYHQDLVEVLTDALDDERVLKVTRAFERLRKAHDLYDQHYKNAKIAKALMLKVEPIIKELEDYGVDKEFSTLLFTFGGRFLDYEFKSEAEYKAKYQKA